MMILREFAALLTGQPAGMVYHLAMLFAGQIVLGVGLIVWRQQRESPYAVRLFAVAATFAATRVVLVVILSLELADLVFGRAVLPPLERFLDFVTLFVSIWAFLPILVRYRRIARTLLAVGLVVGTGIYVLSAFLWLRRVLEGSPYNHFWQSSAWEVLSIAILVPTLFVAALSRRDDWGLLTCLFALWLAGHALEFAAPIVDADAPGWVRLANLVAIPVFASLAFRSALRVAPPEPSTLPDRLVGALASLSRAGQRSEKEAALAAVAAALVPAMGADVVALATVDPHAHSRLRLVAVYPAQLPARRGQAVTVSASDYPALRDSMGPQQPTPGEGPSPVDPLDAVQLDSGQRVGHDPLSSASQVDARAALFATLGFDRPGPLMVCPVRDHNQLVGAVFAGNPVSQREWRVADQRILEAVGPAIGAAMGSGQFRPTRDLADQLGAARARERELELRLAEMERQGEANQARLAAVVAAREHFRQESEQQATRLRQLEGVGTGTGGAGATSADVDLELVIEQAADSLSDLFRERSQTFEANVSTGLPAVSAEPAAVGQIVTATLKGASLAAREGTGISLMAQEAAASGEAELSRESVLVSVRYGLLRAVDGDEGGTPSPDESESARARLSVAKGLVQFLGGLYWVERARDGRVTVSLTLPVAQGGTERMPEADGPPAGPLA